MREFFKPWRRKAFAAMLGLERVFVAIWDFFRERIILWRYRRWKNEEEFWRVAALSAPFRYRFLRKSLTAEQVDAEFSHRHFPPWLELKQIVRPTDLIWPFEFNQNTLSYRKG